MSVRQLKDGRWICEYTRGKNPEAPDSKRAYCGRGPEGERAAHALNISLGLGARQIVKTPLFVEIAQAYLEARGGIIAATTEEAFLVRMKKTILPILGEYMAHELTPEVLDRYVARRGKTVKRTTIHRELSDIRAVVRWAVSRRLISSNPMDGYEMPRRDDARIRPPSKEEIEAIINHSADHLRRAILLSYNSGLRPGKEELLSLTWESCDLIGRTIMITSAQKGGLEQRTIPMSPAFADLMGQWYEQDRKAGMRYIIHYNGGQVASLKKAWKAAKARAKITRRIRMYDLRHAFATTLLARGGDTKTISKMLGHRSVSMTLEIYQHVTGDLAAQAISLLDEIGGDLPHKIDSKRS